jgi:hypothetical protein
MQAVEALSSTTGTLPACRALGVARATQYRYRAGPSAARPRRPSPRPTPGPT